MVYSRPFLLVFGGNTGTVAVNDVWILNIEKSPHQWIRNICESESPCIRVYHSAGLCQSGSANGMMVVFGGRTSDQSPLNDCWGLRKHRDGKWDWVQAPNRTEQPTCRYQHQVAFYGSIMLVFGGRTNMSEEQSQTLEIYDTESSEWYKINCLNRYRHAMILQDQYLYVHGGFEPEFPNKPLDSLLQFDVKQIAQTFPKLAKNFGIENNNVLQESFHNNGRIGNLPNYQQTLPPQNAYQQLQQHKKISYDRSITPIKQSNNNLQYLKNVPLQSSIANKNIRLSNQAVVATIYNIDEDPTSNIQKVPLQKLAEESKRLGVGFQDPNQNLPQTTNSDTLCDLFIQNLLRPKEWRVNELRLPFKKELILHLCDEVIKILQEQATVQRLRVPIKIFGSIFGRFNELLRFFDNFGIPSESFEQDGDIERFDYLFLGNYVDRGFNSLETICLLLALKVKYPEQIMLLRGQHEDSSINKICGFGEECSLRISEDIDDEFSVFHRINQVFEYFPVAAVIDDKIFCVNNGLGPKINRLSDLDQIQRPINLKSNDMQTQMVQELLWNEYSNTDINIEQATTKQNWHQKIICRFGDIKVNQFLAENNLNMLIRGSECVAEGLERNKLGTVTNIFSCPDYTGKFKNSGALIKIKKNFQIIPYQLPCQNIKLGTWILPESNIKSNINYKEEELKLKKRQISPPKSQTKRSFVQRAL
eukprot:TRINITY_DN2786_c0_g1_i1.p1 TRINITY_DN2786_c0_g1~~TRINITY_DN2786_c0_g1_i1.p1  ORF type:complete len:703 (+),score=70.10 TRINITY_DN2786_c0_g1_i1:335-2443(+)